MIKSLLCLAKGHTVNRNRVWHDGQNFRTRCASCNTQMLRDRNGWRKFDESTDSGKGRLPHPRVRELA